MLVSTISFAEQKNLRLTDNRQLNVPTAQKKPEAVASGFLFEV